VNADGALADLRNQLDRTAEGDDRSKQNVRGKGQVSHRIAADVAHHVDPVPSPVLKISCKGRRPIKGDEVKHKHRLADDGYQEPEHTRAFQGGFRK
jgi:hypothetical protein